MSDRTCDTLIIGSGFGGAALARRLAEAGHDVLVAEKGPALDPTSDFRQTQDPNYFRRYLKSAGDGALNLTYAEALGGGSGFYEMVSLRAPTLAFEQRDADGRRLWPASLDRRALDPWYERAERELQVEQIAAEDVPRTGWVFAHLMSRLGYSTERARYAVQGCLGSGFCIAGCIYGAKQSLLINYLPAARAAGAALLTGYEAIALRPLAVDGTPYNPALPRNLTQPYEVTLAARPEAGAAAGATLRVRARLVILAGGTVGSAQLLLRSRRWLPRLSPAVGRHIAFNGSIKLPGLLPDDCPDGDMYTGRSHPGVVSYEFLASHGIMLTAGKALPLQVAAGARLSFPGEPVEQRLFGAGHVEMMRLFRRRVLLLVAFGLTPPAGRLRLDRGGNARVDLDPAARTELEAYHRRTHALLTSILERSGCRPLHAEALDTQGRSRDEIQFSSTHHVGSCRMADDPAHGVVNADGEVFGHPGIYVVDGAAITSASPAGRS